MRKERDTVVLTYDEWDALQDILMTMVLFSDPEPLEPRSLFVATPFTIYFNEQDWMLLTEGLGLLPVPAGVEPEGEPPADDGYQGDEEADFEEDEGVAEATAAAERFWSGCDGEEDDEEDDDEEN